VTRRKRWLLLWLVTGAAALGLAVYLLWPRSPINRANYDRIAVGMTRPEVEAILGGPARNETSGTLRVGLWGDGDPRWMEGALIRFLHEPDGPMSDVWATDRFVVWIDFGPDGAVAKKSCAPVSRAREWPLERIRHWLGL
jgi:hypothetical protein